MSERRGKPPPCINGTGSMNRIGTRSDMRASVFDIQRFSVHDGPGIRTTVFFKGCPLRCAWCQNPESMAPVGQLLLYPELCLHCGVCAKVCPEIQGTGECGAEDPFRPETCGVCGRCVDVCPSGARRIAGREAGIEEIMESALRDRPFYGEKGGVTLGGGEPLAQWAFVRALADGLRSRDVHVALDTSCAAPREVVAAVPDHVDLVLADLKLVTPEKHRRWTGADNAPILETIRLWSRAMPSRLWVSVPLIPGVQDEDEIGRIAEYILSLEARPPVRLLPYHRLGDSKYEALSRPAPGFTDSTDRLMETARAAFAGEGVHILEG